VHGCIKPLSVRLERCHATNSDPDRPSRPLSELAARFRTPTDLEHWLRPVWGAAAHDFSSDSDLGRWRHQELIHRRAPAAGRFRRRSTASAFRNLLKGSMRPSRLSRGSRVRYDAGDQLKRPRTSSMKGGESRPFLRLPFNSEPAVACRRNREAKSRNAEFSGNRLLQASVSKARGTFAQLFEIMHHMPCKTTGASVVRLQIPQSSHVRKFCRKDIEAVTRAAGVLSVS